MPLNAELVDELNLLAKFDDTDHTKGIKVRSDAGEALVSAAQRLFDKGMTSAADGGYLTALGQEVVDHFTKTLRVLTSG